MLVSLQALATLYGLTLIDLMRGRAGDRPVLVTNGSGVLAGLAQGDVHLRSLLVTADAGAGVDVFHGHPGEEFICVVSGQRHLAFTDDRAYVLDTGDSVAFPSERLHRWHAGDSIMQAIWVHRDAAVAGRSVPARPRLYEKRRGLPPPTPRDAV